MHDRADNVGVVVVEDLTAGTEMLCRITEDNSTFRMTVLDDVPIGHKVAIVDLVKDDTVIKYGEDIGRMVGEAAKGKHVHVHNLKTKRW
jgi:(2R)-sulfolactate sulfo-lyase subunit alpha